MRPDALRNTLDLAQLADRLGYHRYWLAEHHGLARWSAYVVSGSVPDARPSHLLDELAGACSSATAAQLRPVSS
jgi:alkanesulfonate monooxygenase SsuD/methylene tetrahydromethanopterin reductase-like flavin-dependent oxidoreductase (luciferase family)